MSDLADKIFNELIKIQVVNAGKIPPVVGIATIRELLYAQGFEGVREIRDNFTCKFRDFGDRQCCERIGHEGLHCKWDHGQRFVWEHEGEQAVHATA